MKQTVKVSFYLKNNETKEDGSCPVMVRLRAGTTEDVFSAKLNAPADLWASLFEAELADVKLNEIKKYESELQTNMFWSAGLSEASITATATGRT